jgi:hypothetical protein
LWSEGERENKIDYQNVRHAEKKKPTGVSQQMSLEVRALIETAVAHGTLVRRLFHVQNLVHRQSATLTKSFPALDAFERLLLGVDVAEKSRRGEKSY